MKISELNETLSSLFDENIRLLELKDQTAKKWYDQSFIKPVNEDFQTGLIYGVSIDNMIEFNFSVKNIDNLFKSFFNSFISKCQMKRLNFETGKNYTREEAQKLVTSGFETARLSKGIMYSTNYGIGVWFIFMPLQWIETTSKAIIARLKELNISYTNEFSDARWVFRFVFDGNYIDHNKIIESIEI